MVRAQFNYRSGTGGAERTEGGKVPSRKPKARPDINRLARKAAERFNAREIRLSYHYGPKSGQAWIARALPRHYNVRQLAYDAGLLQSGTLPEVAAQLARLDDRPIAQGQGATAEAAIASMAPMPWKPAKG